MIHPRSRRASRPLLQSRWGLEGVECSGAGFCEDDLFRRVRFDKAKCRGFESPALYLSYMHLGVCTVVVYFSSSLSLPPSINRPVSCITGEVRMRCLGSRVIF